MSSPCSSLVQLCVVADAEPSVLARVLERFQNLNVLPRRVVVEHATTGLFHVQVDVAGMSEPALTLVAGKIGEVPSVHSAYWQYV